MRCPLAPRLQQEAIVATVRIVAGRAGQFGVVVVGRRWRKGRAVTRRAEGRIPLSQERGQGRRMREVALVAGHRADRPVKVGARPDDVLMAAGALFVPWLSDGLVGAGVVAGRAPAAGHRLVDRHKPRARRHPRTGRNAHLRRLKIRRRLGRLRLRNFKEELGQLLAGAGRATQNARGDQDGQEQSTRPSCPSLHQGSPCASRGDHARIARSRSIDAGGLPCFPRRTGASGRSTAIPLPSSFSAVRRAQGNRRACSVEEDRQRPAETRKWPRRRPSGAAACARPARAGRGFSTSVRRGP